MQGRLLPPVGGRIQSFPVLRWRDEFAHARDAGIDGIEWIYEAGTDAQNPLSTDAGLAEIRHLADSYGVFVRSVCADYFMTDTLVDDTGRPRSKSIERLRWLIDRAGAASLRYMVLPFVDASSAARLPTLDALRAILRAALTLAETFVLELHLETDLAPMDLAALLSEVGHPLLRANLDIGNSASLGHEADSEMRAIGPWLGSVHVKDRVLGGATVALGKGDADFATYFSHLATLGYSGTYILQVARGSPGEEVELARRNRAFVESAMMRSSGRSPERA